MEGAGLLKRAEGVEERRWAEGVQIIPPHSCRRQKAFVYFVGFWGFLKRNQM